MIMMNVDRNIVMWDLATGHQKCHMKANLHNHCVFLPSRSDGELLASASDGHITLWKEKRKSSGYTVLRSAKLFKEPITSLRLVRGMGETDFFAATSMDGTCIICESLTLDVVRVLHGELSHLSPIPIPLLNCSVSPEQTKVGFASRSPNHSPSPASLVLDA